MPVKLLSVSKGVTGATEFNYVISEDSGRQSLEGVLTLEEVGSVVERKSYGAVLAMCRAIVDTKDYESLVGRQFES